MSRSAGVLAIAAAALALPALAAPPVEDSLAQRLRACTACHAATDVVTADAYFPRLAGKPAGYLTEQLHNFREGRRHYAPMERLLAGLPEAYLAEMAGYFAAQTPRHDPSAAMAPTPAPSRGERVVRDGVPAAQVPACVQCHGSALTGIAPAVPGLLGLPKNYLAAQLGAWRTGQRQARAPDCMAQIARRLPADDLAAAVAWLAAQPLPPDARPASVAPARWPLDCGSLQPSGASP